MGGKRKRNRTLRKRTKKQSPFRGPVSGLDFLELLVSPDETERSEIGGCVVRRVRKLVLDRVSRNERGVDEIGGEVRGEFVRQLQVEDGAGEIISDGRPCARLACPDEHVVLLVVPDHQHLCLLLR